MKNQQESAVSPVVGVMLMLVVTIIIAAVVSAFAGGMGSDQTKTPQATLAARFSIDDVQDEDTATHYGPDYPTDFTARNGIEFEHKGGDSFGIDDIYIQVQYGDTKYDLDTSDPIQTTSGNCLPSDVTSYLMEVGDDDGYITPGDKFMLFTDNCFIDERYGKGPGFSFQPEGAAHGMSVFKNTDVQYKVVDKESQKVIASGELNVK